MALRPHHDGRSPLNIASRVQGLAAFPLLQRNKDITVANVDPLGSIGVMRFNQLQPMANEAGAAPLMGKRDLLKAKELVKESGYNGERIVLLSATDQPIVNAQANVVAAEMREVGLNFDLQAMDWGTLITRRASREPVDKNGWSVFFTWFVGPDMLNPALSFPLRANGQKAWFGWPTDDKLEALHAQWMEASELAAQQKIAQQLQEEAFASVPFVPTGQFVIPTAFRKNLKGVAIAPWSSCGMWRRISASVLPDETSRSRLPRASREPGRATET
jgi:peptide/nickel transport system substrate-binding protein